jgi:nitrate reductase alpha subunit
MRALELGAVDFVTKPKISIQSGMREYTELISDKIRAAAKARIKPRTLTPTAPTGALPALRNPLTSSEKLIIIGASINHWYNNNLSYRAPITALLLCGCCGRNGGGMNHYVGQEKLTLVAPWTSLAFALDWSKPPRLQQSPTWHYVQSDQWRYEGDFTDYAPVPPRARLEPIDRLLIQVPHEHLRHQTSGLLGC